MGHEWAKPYVVFIADDALSFREPLGLPCDAPTDFDWLIGWQCRFEPQFVRVRSYLPEISLSRNDAVDLAVNGLLERKWFANGQDTEPDYILEPKCGDA